MYLITASFDVEQANSCAAELLALGDSPDHLADLLGVPLDLESVREGVQPASFQQVLADVGRLKKFATIEEQIQKLQADQSMLRFLGAGFKEKQLAKLQSERDKLGSVLDAPRFFYRQPRVRLLSSIRDYALDHSRQGEPAWSEVDEKSIVFPIAAIFERADLEGAQILVDEIEKPLKDISPRFLLESFEGHRSIQFDFEHGTVLYYTPAPTAPA